MLTQLKTLDFPSEFADGRRSSRVTLLKQHEKFCNLHDIRVFVETFPDVFMVMNENREIVYCNAAMLKLTNAKSNEELIGLRLGETLSCIHADNKTGGCGTTEYCTACGGVTAILSGLKGSKDTQECRILHNGGFDALDLRVWSTPYIIDNESFVFLSAVDISDEKRRETLEQIFFHDILNVAGGLRGLAEISRNMKKNDPEVMEMIYNLSDRLIDEIKAQRQISMAENNDLTVYPDTIETSKIISDIIDTYKNHKVAKDREIIVANDSSNTQFKSDPELLRRVLGNMVKNALEASLPGQTVTISSKKKTGKIEFSVHNRGFMPRNVQLQLFNRNYSTKGMGRGLGTYSIKLLTEKYLNGKVWFESNEENGTTFYVEYPLSF